MPADDAIDVESTTLDHAGLVPVVATPSIEPAVSPGRAVELQDGYRSLVRALLDESDYQKIGTKSFVKKSGWRKLAVAFNVSTELISSSYQHDDTGRTATATMVVRATAPNGRTMDGLGVCDIHERCCPAAWGQPCPKRDWAKHTCCSDGCNGRTHFTNAQHDIPATAMTRATNRACSDLFGMGEVSAEEMYGETAAYEEINGEQIPAEPRMETRREGPGADLDKIRKRIYGLLCDKYGRKPTNDEIAQELYQILGVDVKTTFKLDAQQAKQVLAELSPR